MTATKSPTRTERKATNADAQAFSSNQSLSHVVRMIAGHADAKQDVLAGVVHSAYFQALRHGNKAQLQGRENSLYEQAKMYSKPAACKSAGFAQPQKAAVYYAAHLNALDNVGVPAKQGADAPIDADTLAESLTLAYIQCVDAYVADVAQIAADKRAASKAAKATEPKPINHDAVDAIKEATDAAAADRAPAVTDISAMVQAVAAALVAGALSAEQRAVLADAVDMAATAEIAALLAAAGAAEEEARINADAELEAA